MSSIPSNLARVPNLLSSQVMLSSITRTNQQLLLQQIQLSTGKRVNRASDDVVAASTISVMDDIIERRSQRLRNLSHAQAALDTLDGSMGELSELLLEARGIGLSQVGVSSDAATRANQAHVIDSILREAIALGNGKFQQLHLFGGDATESEPFEGLLDGIRYLGQGSGLTTDLGVSDAIPITISAVEAFGALSSRVEGDHDFNPQMTTNTLLADLNGAQGLGINLGSINVDVGGTDLVVDLSEAHTVGDVITTLLGEIQSVDPGAAMTVDPATGNRFRITPSAGVTITISDPVGTGTAADLGLDGAYPPAVATTGADVDPRITTLTPLSTIPGLTLPLGTLRLTNADQSRDLDLSAATSVQDIQNAVAGLNIGIRVEIHADGDRLNFINELSGGDMSIAEVAGGTTATELGVRSLNTTTLLSDFNNGLGINVVDGSVDPITGAPDPAADIDFRITLHDGTSFTVDLVAPETVQDVLDAINAAAVGAALAVPADFVAGLAGDGNGITLTDNTAGPPGSTITVVEMNGSHAADDLGILGSTTSATLTGEDRATVAVDSVFTHLMALREALTANDERGISLATGKLEADLDRAAEARAVVGVRSQRVSAGALREEELLIQDTSLRSQVQDLDMTEAAIRFAQLQQQLQAGLATAAQVQSLSLLDFLR